MNQRGNYKHQTHSKEIHIPTDYKHQTHSKITSTKPIYPQIGAIAARRRWRSVLFVLGEEERTVVWVLGESDGKKEKKKEKKGCIRRYGAQAVGQVWVPQKVEKF